MAEANSDCRFDSLINLAGCDKGQKTNRGVGARLLGHGVNSNGPPATPPTYRQSATLL
jgi:hypothetical protein